MKIEWKSKKKVERGFRKQQRGTKMIGFWEGGEKRSRSRREGGQNVERGKKKGWDVVNFHLKNEGNIQHLHA